MQVLKTKYTFDAIKFLIYLISLSFALNAQFSNLEKRLTVIESEMKYKVDESRMLEKMDSIKDDISEKIEMEIGKIKSGK
jgi:uncharacterized protein YoxC